MKLTLWTVIRGRNWGGEHALTGCQFTADRSEALEWARQTARFDMGDQPDVAVIARVEIEAVEGMLREGGPPQSRSIPLPMVGTTIREHRLNRFEQEHWKRGKS